jgi:hypothetical protein
MQQGAESVAKLLKNSDLLLGLPLTYGDMSLSLVTGENIFSIMPFKGKNIDVSKKLKNQFNLPLPDSNQKVSNRNIKIIWAGLDQWLITNCSGQSLQTLLFQDAAITEQTDGWVRLSLNDTKTCEVMARLCPVEPILAGVIKTQIAGMMAIVSFDKSGIEMFFMRSMIQTAIREIELAMKSVNALKFKNG